MEFLKKYRMLPLGLLMFLVLVMAGYSSTMGGTFGGLNRPLPQVEAELKTESLPEGETASVYLPLTSAAEEEEPAIEEPLPEDSIVARLKEAASLRESPGGRILEDIPAGKELVVLPTEDPFWFAVLRPDGAAGCLYGEKLFRTTEEGLSPVSLTEEAVKARLSLLRLKLPEGKYWNHRGLSQITHGRETPWIVTDIPCDHAAEGQGQCNYYTGVTGGVFDYGTLCECLGFASLLSDQVFGEQAPIHLFEDCRLLRPGDHIRLQTYSHSMIVTDRDEAGVTLAEVNYDYQDCLISWSRKLTWQELTDLSWDTRYISRYPYARTAEGGIASWGDAPTTAALR